MSGTVDCSSYNDGAASSYYQPTNEQRSTYDYDRQERYSRRDREPYRSPEQAQINAQDDTTSIQPEFEYQRDEQRNEETWPSHPEMDSTGGRYNPQASSYEPIHYQFQTPNRPFQADSHTPDDGVPRTSSFEEPDDYMQQQYQEFESSRRESASPRQDAVTRYMSTKRGRLLLTMSSGTVGAALGGFVGKSITKNHARPFILAMCLVMMMATNILRNPYGELSRALGLALVYAVQQTSQIRKRYPTATHIKACVGAGPRRPFPPSENPWQFDGPEFKMMYSVVAMAFIGTVVGGNIPLIPTWIGAMAGAALLAFSTTTKTARGDLARTMGMRVVALMEEVIDINAELGLLGKAALVGGKVLDKILIMDRKHKIKDKIIAGSSFLYNKAARTASRVQSDMQEGEDRDRPPGERSREPRDGIEERRTSGDESYSREPRRDRPPPNRDIRFGDAREQQRDRPPPNRDPGFADPPRRDRPPPRQDDRQRW